MTNLDGGTATSAVVQPAATTPPPKKHPFHVTAVHGHAVAGKTVTLTITGTGFFGAPRITSNLAGTRARVYKDNGKTLWVHVSTPAGAHGTHVFTIRLANGKSAKKAYSVVA